jgi:DNA polymerase elongation subunit (family B)
LEGWIFDLYPASDGGIVIWLLTREGPVRLHDSWRPSIFAWTKNTTIIPSLLANHGLSDVGTTIDYKYVRPNDFERSKVLRLSFRRSRDIAFFLKNINPTTLIETRLFNVDIPVAQLYLYEKNLFPLAFVRAYTRGNDVRWEMLDDADSCRYETPPLKGAGITVHLRKFGRVPSFNDPIESITVQASGSAHEIDKGSEADKLLELVRLIEEIDPDVVLTKNGDSFLFPYLIQRAFQNQILSRFIFDREGRHLQQARNSGKSYFSYGRIYYRPNPIHLLGRLHLDGYNDFIFEDCGLQGLIEIARTCRTPLRRASRETIGTNMTSLQMYQAFRRDILIPWKKNEPENFKSAWELLKADRGGFILEPKIGLFDSVGEIDFASLYPTLMMKYNLTPECISCHCCSHTPTQVPELGYNLCEKKIGIVPHTLRTLLFKRAEYKTLMSKTTDQTLREIYDQRQAALKWALVCSFGYLGYKNARFGKIDAHIGVCAFARKILHETIETVQKHGYSVWLTKRNASEDDYIRLCDAIQMRLGLPISFEGIYRWIVFLPSKVHAELPVLNRYYGVFRDGKVKMRGIEYRRRDTPPIIKQCQQDLIDYFTSARSRAEFLTCLPGTLPLVQQYLDKLHDGQVEAQDLLITKQLSKEPSEYKHNVSQAIAAKQLASEGVQISAGQNVSYILQHICADQETSVLPSELIDGSIRYDVKKYEQLLLDAVEGLLAPLGYDYCTLRTQLQAQH